MTAPLAARNPGAARPEESWASNDTDFEERITADRDLFSACAGFVVEAEDHLPQPPILPNVSVIATTSAGWGAIPMEVSSSATETEG